MLVFAVQLPMQGHALVHLNPFLMQPQRPALHTPPLHPHFNFLHRLMACVICWCASWIVHFCVLLYKRPKEWELIPESRLNMCESVSLSVPMQITLGVLCIILPVRWILAYCWKFSYFIQPHEYSHALCAQNLFSPAWYIDSYLYWDVKLAPSPYLRM